MNGLELRMYFFVPYNISDIQKGIQAGHAALQYAFMHGSSTIFKDFAEYDKTWIILNGGTTNYDLIGNPRLDENPYKGSLDNIAHQLVANNIQMAVFQEPDLNDALSAVCFIADERVFNHEKYPDFATWLMEVKMYPDAYAIMQEGSKVFLQNLTPEQCTEAFPTWYPEWKEFLGGEKNLFLRNLIRGKKLA
jgi:hypothetical protein